MARNAEQYAPPAGFSLLELVMVTAIISVVAAVAVPRYNSSLQHYRTEAVGRQIIAELTRAQTLARQSSAEQRVQFDLTQHRMLMIDQAGNDDTQAVRTVWFGRRPYHATLVSVDFNGTSTVSFDGHGQPAHGGTIVLASGSRQKTITLHPISGEASLN